MGQKTFKRLRKLAKAVAEQKVAPGAKLMPETYTVNGQTKLNPAKGKGTYRWLKNNHRRMKKSVG
jgi:hypothetical protein